MLAVTLVACGNDDKDEPSESDSQLIVGTWEGEVTKSIAEEKIIFKQYEHLVQFRADGKYYEVTNFVYTDEWAEINGESGDLEILSGTWTKHGDNIVIKTYAEELNKYMNTECEYKIKGNRLTVTIVTGIAAGIGGVFNRVNDSRIEKYIK